MKALFKRMRKDQRGQTATEYMLIIAGIVLVIGVSMRYFGTEVRDHIRDNLVPRVLNILK